MSTETQTFETIQQLKDALPNLPDDAVIVDCDDDNVPRWQVGGMSGVYAPYTVKYEPAPLDPSKVKAGDTVTVEVVTLGGATADLTGEVRGNGFALWVGPICITLPADDIERVTFTAHQPAPEPEPEWKPGTVAVVIQGGDPGAGVDDHEFRAALQTDGTWVGLAGEAATAAPVSVRPLVVIDPAAARKALEDNGWGEHEMAEILHHLGIEATS